MLIWVWADTQDRGTVHFGRKKHETDGREFMTRLFTLDIMEFAEILTEQMPPPMVAQVLEGLRDNAGERFPIVVKIACDVEAPKEKIETVEG